MENVGAVTVYVDALDILGVDIARDMVPAVDHKDGLARRLRTLCKDRTEEACADNEIIIMIHKTCLRMYFHAATINTVSVMFTFVYAAGILCFP
jgi:hypothetical protein